MPSYDRCPPSVQELANEILCEFETHKPLLDAKVKIEYLFAYPGESGGPAIMNRGVPALAVCKKIPVKQRVAGRGDAEITIDHSWWSRADRKEKRALLDHELHHLEVPSAKRDDAGRPKLRLRKHDVEIGWFQIIAERHGDASIERQQAQDIFDRHGQAFWPSLLK